MLIFPPDAERQIDLPGVGACPRPVDIDRSLTGFSNLVALRVYRFAAGAVIDGEAEEDEVFVIAMRGRGAITVTDAGGEVQTFAVASEGGVRAVYLPPHGRYRLTPETDCEIAYARAVPRGVAPQPSGFEPGPHGLDVAGYASGMDIALTIVEAGGTANLARDPRVPERFVHVRAFGDGMTAMLGSRPFRDWETAALGGGESVDLVIRSGQAEVLAICASRAVDGRVLGPSPAQAV